MNQQRTSEQLMAALIRTADSINERHCPPFVNRRRAANDNG
jgi:hypothetical protein